MRRLYKLIIPALVLLFVACDDQLNLEPEDTLSPGTYFSSAKELELWTNYFYSQLDNADGQAAQNADDNVDNGLGDLMMGQRDASSENGWNWGMLRRINYYLQNSSNCPDVAARNHYDGIAYFSRAYFYFLKVRRYGDVPWYNQVLGSADDELLFKERDDRGLVMDSVMADLDKAIDLLPATKNKVRITKWTALAFKSRAALYEGTFRKYHQLDDADKYLQQAADAASDFITSSGYKLFTAGDEPYRNLFNTDEANDEEVILTRIYSSAANLMHGVQFNIINGKQGLTRRFMNHYLMADGSRFTDQPGWETKLYTEEVQSRDPRLKQTVLTPGYIQKSATAPTRNNLNAVTGYQPIKFVAEPAHDGAVKSISDWPLFRVAEVYLNYAEAKAELGTITQEDLDISINRLRARAKMPDLSLAEANANVDPLLLEYYPNVTQSENTGAILEVRRERTIELVMEGFRQWDLLRWKEGKQFEGPFYGIYFPGEGKYDMDNDGTDDLALWSTIEESINGGISLRIGSDIVLSEGDSGYIVAYPNTTLNWVEKRDYLWPIPASERVITGGVLTQNEGWEDSTNF